jgi:hypothetical protein
MLNTARKVQKSRIHWRRRFKEFPVTRLSFDSTLEDGGPSSQSSANGKCCVFNVISMFDVIKLVSRANVLINRG